ncbi:hypothetical protein FRC17_010830 [Serendipita sp. 399]|nr:hypothetical protein FRC17_010830 [Serendipita sp. 399]
MGLPTSPDPSFRISRNTAEVLTTPGGSSNNPPPSEVNPTPTGNSPTNPSSGSSTSAPNVSITTNVPGYTPVPLPGVSQPIPGGGIGSANPSSATQVGQPVGSPGGDENKPGISIGTVAGITVGVAVLLIGIAVFWILRRRARLKEEPLEERQQDTTTQPGMSTTVHPFVSGPYEDWANPPGPSSDRSDLQGLAGGEKGGRPIVQPPLEEPNGNGVGENNLASARAMVSETIPHLSQRDIDRLAEVVIQRMPAAAMRAGSDADLNQVVQSGKELIVKSGTCTTSFTHRMSVGTATWCDQTWANQLEGLIQACLPKGQWAFCSPTGMELLYFFNEDALATSAIPSNTVPATTPAATTSSNALPSATSAAQPTTNIATSSTAATTTPLSVPLPSQSQTSSVADDTSPPVGSNTTDGSTLPSSPSPSSSSPAPATENRNSKTNTAVAIGAAIGAVAALLLIVAGFWIWRRRNQREKEALDLVEEEDQHDGTQTMGQTAGAVWQPASAAVAAKYANGSPRRFTTTAAAYSSHSLTAPLTQPDVSTSDGTESSEGGGLAPQQQQQQQQLTEAEISRLADGLVAHMLMAPPEYENAVRGNRSANPGGTNLQPPPPPPPVQ